MSTVPLPPGPSGGLPFGLVADDPGAGNVTAFGPSLWRRFYQSLPGDPTGPTQHLAGGAVAFGLAVPDFAQSATVTVTGDTAHLTFDGETATAALGLALAVGQVFNITGRASLKAASFFPNSAATVVDVQYWT